MRVRGQLLFWDVGQDKSVERDCAEVGRREVVLVRQTAEAWVGTGAGHGRLCGGCAQECPWLSVEVVSGGSRPCSLAVR